MLWYPVVNFCPLLSATALSVCAPAGSEPRMRKFTVAAPSAGSVTVRDIESSVIPLGGLSVTFTCRATVDAERSHTCSGRSIAPFAGTYSFCVSSVSVTAGATASGRSISPFTLSA